MNDFGRMIRINRQTQALTLKKLSHRTGLSVSFLSEIERGKSQPSIASLRKISQALGISLLSLTEQDEQRELDNRIEPFSSNLNNGSHHYIHDAKVVRANRRKRISFPGMTGYFELLTPDLNRKLEALSFKVNPGFESGKQFVDPPGEKFMIILSGILEFYVGPETFLLNKGDSLSYPADAPVGYKVIGDETVTGILVITPPGF